MKNAMLAQHGAGERQMSERQIAKLHKEAANSRKPAKQVVLQHDEGCDKIAGVKVHQQGNLEYYSAENVATRHDNRHDPRVVAVLDRMWSGAQVRLNLPKNQEATTNPLS